MNRILAISMLLLLGQVGCMGVPCADSVSEMEPMPSPWTQFRSSCTGIFNFGAPCIPRLYFSPHGYDDFCDHIVVCDAAMCNARRAYRRFCRASGTRYSVDFCDGFFAAYRNYAQGFPPTTPPLPPRKYWAAHYRTPKGHAQAADWLSGYETGMDCARSEPISEYNIVPANTVLEREGLRVDHQTYSPAPTDVYPSPYGY